MLKQLLILASAVGVCACSSTPAAVSDAPGWLEADSAAAIASRTRADFPWTVDEFYEMALRDEPSLTREELQRRIDHRYVETLAFGDTVRVFRKALRNMRLLDPQFRQGSHRGATASAARISYVDSILAHRQGHNPLGGAHRVVYRFTVDVPNHDAILGDTLRVWLPMPMATQRQSNIRVLEASHPYTLSDGRSEHNSIYFEAPVGAAGDTTHFEYTATFDTRGEYFPADHILDNLRPYDKASELYRRYTAAEAPHIVRLDSLARSIAGDETNPYLISEKVYDYIINRYPWAGAREYSTIDCIPDYVVREGHGDCGQVSLLYISLMRTLGIPARWESGWMLHPGEKNLHDWAEVYFEGVGWVPVDVSFGRYTPSDNPEIVGFYSHGMDSHRFAANHTVCGDFYPRKRFVRSETVDAQMGEVETTRGNLFYPAWSSSLRLISVTPIETE